MALDIKHTTVELGKECDIAKFKDLTGNYDAVTNPGGYGAPNPVRSTIAPFLAVFRYNPDGEDERIEGIDNTDPSADEWEIVYPGDGYIYSFLIFTLRYQGLPAGQNVLLFHNGLFYLSVKSTSGQVIEPGTNTSIWREVDPYDYIDVPVNSPLFFGRNDEIYSCKLDRCYAEETSRRAKGTCCDKCLKDDNWIRLDVLRQGAAVECSRNQYLSADEIIRQANNLCDSLECEQCNPH